jgi:hypothetical protein
MKPNWENVCLTFEENTKIYSFREDKEGYCIERDDENFLFSFSVFPFHSSKRECIRLVSESSIL